MHMCQDKALGMRCAHTIAHSHAGFVKCVCVSRELAEDIHMHARESPWHARNAGSFLGKHDTCVCVCLTECLGVSMHKGHIVSCGRESEDTLCYKRMRTCNIIKARADMSCGASIQA